MEHIIVLAVFIDSHTLLSLIHREPVSAQSACCFDWLSSRGCFDWLSSRCRFDWLSSRCCLGWPAFYFLPPSLLIGGGGVDKRNSHEKWRLQCRFRANQPSSQSHFTSFKPKQLDCPQMCGFASQQNSMFGYSAFNTRADKDDFVIMNFNFLFVDFCYRFYFSGSKCDFFIFLNGSLRVVMQC